MTKYFSEQKLTQSTAVCESSHSAAWKAEKPLVSFKFINSVTGKGLKMLGCVIIISENNLYVIVFHFHTSKDVYQSKVNFHKHHTRNALEKHYAGWKQVKISLFFIFSFAAQQVLNLSEINFPCDGKAIMNSRKTGQFSFS